MKAKEMFEKLGYRLAYSYNKNKIRYAVNYYSISFDTELKTIETAEDNTERMEINIDELKAIIQQCKELGWLD